jgi:drug/metabolite transporter (DMT)-like permease
MIPIFSHSRGSLSLAFRLYLASFSVCLISASHYGQFCTLWNELRGSLWSLYWAEQTVASGLAALLIATEPMFILIFGWLAGQQKISRLSALGLGLGVLGVGLLMRAEVAITTSSLLGLAAVLLASASWAAGVVISPRVRLQPMLWRARRFRCFVAP